MSDEKGQYFDLLQSMTDPVLKLDLDGVILFANQAAERILRLRDGVKLNSLCPIDSALCIETALSQAARGESASFTTSISANDGTKTPWKVAVTPIYGLDGKVAALAATCLPLSVAERKVIDTHDQILAAICDSMQAGVSVLNTNLEILRANQMMEDWYTDGRPLVGRKCHKAYHGRDVPCEFCPVLRAIETGNMQMEVVPLVGSEGPAGWLEIHALPFTDEEGRVIGVVENVIDVTERKRTEERLQHVARMSAVGQLAGGIAHEFNNIMASIMGYAQLAMQSDVPEYTRRALEVAESGCKRGKEITDSLLAFANPRGLRREPIRVEECVENALGLAHMELANAHIDVKVGDASSLPDLLLDRRQMGQVFLNLFMNARQAMPEGGELHISFKRVKCSASQASGVRCHIEVRDTGVGMSQSEIDRIFDPFFTTKGRLGNSETPGLGLGLSVAHGLVMAHEGELHVSSVQGEGTRIVVCLPLPDGSSCAHGPEVLTVSDTVTASQSARFLRILIAEDEDPLRELLCEMLRARGHEVTGAADGQQAMRALQSNEWDLVITDILMPKANGTELLKQLRNECRTVPCIVISGRGEDILQRQAAALGAAVCLRKPFDITEILAAVEQATQSQG